MSHGLADDVVFNETYRQTISFVTHNFAADLTRNHLETSVDREMQANVMEISPDNFFCKLDETAPCADIARDTACCKTGRIDAQLHRNICARVIASIHHGYPLVIVISVNQ
ncbi:MAG TPA: hypothetical protein VN448_08830 [Gammaproteobacteria bacterium]|nr:hypothetical protein [Gammaproteobacteria bacterium]